MTGALTARADPVTLVPGDLPGVRAMAHELGGLARRAGDTSGVLRSIEAGSWVGPAGEAFRERIGQMPSRLEAAADAFHDAGRAFDSYADELTEARHQAVRAIDLMADADAATATWVTAAQRYDSAVERVEQVAEDTGEPARPPGVARPASSDPGEPLREQARTVLGDARDSVAEQGRRAAGTLQAAADAAPDEPGLFSRAMDQVGEFFKGAGEATWGILEFAYKLSSVYLLVDPEGYVSHLDGLREGVVFAVQNPKEFALAVLDWETWKENPARALGRLVPDLLLALATGGVGAVATRGAFAARRLDGLAAVAPTRRLPIGDGTRRSFGDQLRDPHVHPTNAGIVDLHRDPLGGLTPDEFLARHRVAGQDAGPDLWKWPDDGGAVAGTRVPVDLDSVIPDRIGGPGGSCFGRDGDLFHERAVPGSSELRPHELRHRPRPRTPGGHQGRAVASRAGLRAARGRHAVPVLPARS